jgi:hypothetical protein
MCGLMMVAMSSTHSQMEAAPLTCVIYSVLILSELMELVRTVTERRLEYRVHFRRRFHSLVPEGLDRDHGAQGSADGDRQQDGIHDHANEERHDGGSGGGGDNNKRRRGGGTVVVAKVAARNRKEGRGWDGKRKGIEDKRKILNTGK